ncbi:MAG: hypothetical protein ACW9W3_07480 [Candidatus Nitrosopumilus sp. bin_68KS]
MEYIYKNCGTGCRASRGIGKNYQLCDKCDKIRQRQKFKKPN